MDEEKHRHPWMDGIPAVEHVKPPRQPRVRAKKFPKKDSTAYKKPCTDVVLRRTLDEIGDEELRATMQRVGDERAMKVLAEMADPKNARKTLAYIVTRAGFARREIVQAFQEYKADEMRVKLARGMPGLADDLIEDSKSVVTTCGKCKGAGVVIAQPGTDPLNGAVEEQCPECEGLGKHRKPGDNDSRKLALEVSGLIRKGGGLNLFMPGSETMDTFDSLISRANDLTGSIPAKAEEVEEQ